MSATRHLLFEIRWFWRQRTWKPTRQKYKAFERDLAVFKASGKVPW